MKTQKTVEEQIFRICKRIFKTANQEKSLILRWDQPIQFEGSAIFDLLICTPDKEYTFFNQCYPTFPLQAHIGTPPDNCLQQLDQLFPCDNPNAKTIRYCSLIVLANHHHLFLYQSQKRESLTEQSIEYYYVDQSIHIESSKTSGKLQTDSSISSLTLINWHYSLHLQSGWNQVFITQQTDIHGVRTIEYSSSYPCDISNLEWNVSQI